MRWMTLALAVNALIVGYLLAGSAAEGSASNECQVYLAAASEIPRMNEVGAVTLGRPVPIGRAKAVAAFPMQIGPAQIAIVACTEHH